MWSHCGISYEIGQRWILAIKLLENCWKIIMKKKTVKSLLPSRWGGKKQNQTILGSKKGQKWPKMAQKMAKKTRQI